MTRHPELGSSRPLLRLVQNERPPSELELRAAVASQSPGYALVFTTLPLLAPWVALPLAVLGTYLFR